jgi:hypothetical protein
MALKRWPDMAIIPQKQKPITTNKQPIDKYLKLLYKNYISLRKLFRRLFVCITQNVETFKLSKFPQYKQQMAANQINANHFRVFNKTIQQKVVYISNFLYNFARS